MPRNTVRAVIHRGEQSGYVAECPELSAVTQGSSLDEAAKNLREAVTLALDGEDLAVMGLVAAPVIVVTFQMETP